ncbi:MAG: 6-phosphogluconolactonase [Veillonella sp.]|uniref:6-phosphogluconolactonase n=1 Tax=Veillonella sp. TaxID=1926307 RepID=UPI0025EF78AC|nr:6-phosphogluconolactonase [Veillonella sp.]MBS4914319.1 6-phosphogluconolactonase [Veillonella sp.]
MAQDLIHIFDTPQMVAEEVAKAFVAFTKETIKATGSCVVAISGGTTPNTLFELLNTDEYRKELDWENIFFLWVDERFVPQTDPDNNFFRAEQRLFGNLSACRHYYPVPTNDGTVEEAADAYEKEVDMVLRACEKDSLDLVLLGLGDDGHTASLFSKSQALHVMDRKIAPVTDGKVWNRVTMTFSFLAKAKHVWFTVVGDSKATALSRVLRQRMDYEEESWQERIDHVLPGAVLSQDSVTWYVDKAAKKLK